MSKEAYYFSHDSNARNDPKILNLRAEYGMQGYGLYWAVIEMMREADDFKLEKKPYLYNAIAMQMQCNNYAKEDAKQFVEFCINECELFADDEHYFWSNSLLKRMDRKNELSDKRRAAAKARWDKTNDTKDVAEKVDANAMQVHANAMQTDAIKGNEMKGNKKENKIIYAEFVKLTETEHAKLIEKYGPDVTQQMIDTLDNYKGANNKKYASDYRAILNWVVERVTGKKEKRTGTGSKFDGVNIGDE